MNFKTRVFINSIICILGLYVIFVSCIDLNAFNRHFYNAKYKELNTAETIEMSERDLYLASDTLLDYLHDYRDDISLKAYVDEENREVYTTREKKHMVDVKWLYHAAIILRNIFLAIIAALVLFLYIDNKKEMKEVLSYTYCKVFYVFLFVLSALLLYALVDFTSFWTMFHKVFFTNDLWLLDPGNSIMINMFPQDFFFALVFRIAFCFFGVLLLIFWWSKAYQKKLLKTL